MYIGEFAVGNYKLPYLTGARLKLSRLVFFKVFITSSHFIIISFSAGRPASTCAAYVICVLWQVQVRGRGKTIWWPCCASGVITAVIAVSLCRRFRHFWLKITAKVVNFNGDEWSDGEDGRKWFHYHGTSWIIDLVRN